MVKPIISHENKYIFFYVPKAACTTIRDLLARHENIDYEPNKLMGGFVSSDFKYITIAQAKKYDYFKFSFVRNPWDRLVSCYMNKVVGVRTMKNSKWVKNGEYLPFLRHFNKNFKEMSFNEFARFVYNTPDNKADPHFRSQHTFIGDCDFIGKVENIDEDLNLIKSKFNISLNHKHLGKTNRFSYREYYSEYTKDLVKFRFIKDIQQFNYEF